MNRRMLLLALVLALFSAVQPVPAEEHRVLMAGYEEKDTYRDWANNLFFKRMEERTGVMFDYLQYDTWEAWQQAKPALLKQGDQLPQVLFKAGLSPAETITLLDEGVLLDLAPLLEEHAPNLWALLQANPDFLQAVLLPDGRIGALPYLNEAPTQNAMWINTKWLNNLRLAMPATAQELTEVLIAFRDEDPNQNIRKDEVPLLFVGSYDLKYLAHAYGLAANDYNVFVQDGQVHYLASEPGFRDFLAWCRSLYEQGLLVKDGFTTVDSLRRVDDSKSTQTYGLVLAPLPSSLMPTDWTTDYALLPPLVHEGEQVYRRVASRATPGAFALTTACKEPEKLLAWVDFLYTQEGAILATNGQEGVDYLVDGDGSWRMTDGAQQSGFLAAATIGTGAVPPGLSSQEFQRRSSQKLVGYVTDELLKLDALAIDPFPPFSLTAQQEAQIAPLQRELGRYVDESIARFVVGEWPLDDTQYAAFQEHLEALGLPDFLAFWQGILDKQVEGTK